MTDAELAVLSIVAEGPIYGFDIQTVIDQRDLREWTNIGVSSMYYVLEKLERQGLITSIGQDETKGPSRRKFRITSAGTGVLQTAVADLLSTRHDLGQGFELGLANLHVLRPSQIRTAFTAYHQELISRLTQTRARWHQLTTSNSPPFNVDAMFDHQVALLEAELEWLEQFITRWEAQAPPDEVAPVVEHPPDIPRMKQVILPHDPDSPHRAPTRPLHSPSGSSVRPPASSTKETAINDSTPPASNLPSQRRDKPPDDPED